MTVEELRTCCPHTHFIKTGSYVDRPDIALMRREFIPDGDTPVFPDIVPGRTRLCPLSVTEYPAVLRLMTAMQAGVWALTKCARQGWGTDKADIECCLANLEMDL